jgi:peptide subunit release factor 1 (eRF1)
LVAHDVSHVKTTGTDHRWSEKNFQRRADEHVRRHAQETVKVLTEADRNYGFDRLLVAGVAEGREWLVSELSDPLRRKLAGSVAMSIVATPQDILRKVEEVHRDVERAEEVRLVDRVMNDAAANGRAVAGLQQTVRALGEGRVRELVIAGTFHPHWDELGEPAAWLHAKPDDASDNLLERMVDRISGSGGRVEMVWGQAAERLEKECGGIGAILRY